MPKVLIFKETLLPPSETFILSQSRALQRYGYQFAGLEQSERSLALEMPILMTKEPGVIAGVRAKLYRRTGFAPLFHKRARQFGPDLVHAHFASGGRTAITLARALSVPLVVTIHGSDITVHGAAAKYRSLGDAASQIICVSAFIRERALQAGLPASKLIVHHIGIDRELFAAGSSNDERKGVLFVGRLVEKKGCEYLVRAMQLVQQQLPDARLTIIGDGPLRGALEALDATLAVSCAFLGARPATEVREAMRSARVLCTPSITAANGDSEGLPTVIAEAQAIGLPVVATLHAGIPEIVLDGETGLLVPEKGHQALAQALIQLLSDSEVCGRFSAAAQLRIAKYFDIKTQTSLLENIYDLALANA